jgi:uncharacterized membrane protein
MNMPIHPYIVHFAVALFSVSFLLDVFGFILRKDSLQQVAWINLLVSGIAVILAVASGLWEENRIAIPEMAQATFQNHQTAAFISAVIILSLLLWRAASKGKIPVSKKWIYLIIGAAGFAALAFTAQQGGKLVYHHSLGVESKIEQKSDSSLNPTKIGPNSTKDFFSSEQDTTLTD